MLWTVSCVRERRVREKQIYHPKSGKKYTYLQLTVIINSRAYMFAPLLTRLERGLLEIQYTTVRANIYIGKIKFLLLAPTQLLLNQRF